MARTKYTRRGTLRMSKAQRSEAITKAWITRRRGKPAKAKREDPVDPVRSEAVKRAWRRRKRADTALVKMTKKKLLTPKQRSVIAKAASARRKKNIQTAGHPPDEA